MNQDQAGTDNQRDLFLNSFDQKRQFFDELSNNDFQSLMKKYGKKELFNKTFSPDNLFSSAVQFAAFQQHFFILNFWPTHLPVNLDNQKRKRLVNLVVAISPEHTDEQILGWLKQIDSNLRLPANFDRNALQKRAIQLAAAYDNIEQILLDNLAYDYLPDTLHFYKMDGKQVPLLAEEITAISSELVKEYQKIIQKNVSANQNIIGQAIDFLSKIGRSQFFVADEKKKGDLGHISEMFIKLDTAIKATINLKKQTISPENLNESALTEIKNTLRPGLQI